MPRPATPEADAWPVFRSYAAPRLRRISLPVGGVGTGTVGFTGSGALRDWEVMNRPAKGYVPEGQGIRPCLVLRAREAGGGEVFQRLLEGPWDEEDLEGPYGAVAPNHGLPRFARARFEAAYPFGRVVLEDPESPVEAAVEAWNPLIPGDEDASGLPVAILQVSVRNPGRRPVEVTVAANVPNFVGEDGFDVTRNAWSGCLEPVGASGNANAAREGGGLSGVVMASSGVPADAETWGSLAVAVRAGGGVSRRTAWTDAGWGGAVIDFWEDLKADGRLDDRVSVTSRRPVASVASTERVAPGATRVLTFLLTWHFPNRRSWSGGAAKADRPLVGNHYTTRFADAWAVAEAVAADLQVLRRRTVAWLRAFLAADLPGEVLEAALFNLSTLRSQTCFRTPDGRFFGWEGCHDQWGSCMGSCTHVWNYEHAVAALFPRLARSMREVEFAYATREDGFMHFRVDLPLAPDHGGKVAAADGQMGCLVKLHREWQGGAGDAWLRSLWPRARAALAFAWQPGGWDADADGVMEGAQHNTMDVEYFGPNPQMQSWYLAALLAGAEMAEAAGDVEFAAKCRDVHARGSAWVDAHLFNGEYYEHEVRPAGDPSRVRAGLISGMGSTNFEAPDLQLGRGCLIDQLAGQPNAHLSGLGLGQVLDRGNQLRALRAVLKHNRCTDWRTHFNPMRTFAAGAETALLMATWPRGERPERPFPYWSEVMTGFEYCVAVHLACEGLDAEAVRVAADVRARYEGGRRNPFDEAECGHHYARAMASWGLVPALSGFRWSAPAGVLRWRRPERKAAWFWAASGACGLVRIVAGARGVAEVEVSVVEGVLGGVRRVELEVGGAVDLKRAEDVSPRRPLRVRIGSAAVVVPKKGGGRGRPRRGEGRR